MPAKEIDKSSLLLNKGSGKISISTWANIQYNNYKAHNEEIKKLFDTVEKMGAPAYKNNASKQDETFSIIKLNLKEPYRPIEMEILNNNYK